MPNILEGSGVRGSALMPGSLERPRIASQRRDASRIKKRLLGGEGGAVHAADQVRGGNGRGPTPLRENSAVKCVRKHLKTRGNRLGNTAGHETYFCGNFSPVTFYGGSCGIVLNSTTRRHPRLGLVAGPRGPAQRRKSTHTKFFTSKVRRYAYVNPAGSFRFPGPFAH